MSDIEREEFEQAVTDRCEAIGFLQSSGVSQLRGGHPATLYPSGATPSPFESSTLVYTHPASAEIERLQSRVAEKCDAPVGWIGPDKYRTARESKMKFFKTIKELREQNEKLQARVAELESDEQEMSGDNNV